MVASLLVGCLFTGELIAALVLNLDDLNDSSGETVIRDGSALDGSPLAGVITYQGGVGAFTVTVTTGISKPELNSGSLSLNSIEVSGAPGSLYVSMTDTDFQSADSQYRVEAAGLTAGTVNLTYLYDKNNGEFTGETVVQLTNMSRSFSDSALATISDPAALYSLSILTEIHHKSAQEVTSFGASITPVPLPGAFWLFGSGIAGWIAMRSKKR